VRLSRNKKDAKAKGYAFIEFKYPEVGAGARNVEQRHEAWEACAARSCMHAAARLSLGLSGGGSSSQQPAASMVPGEALSAAARTFKPAAAPRLDVDCWTAVVPVSWDAGAW
jgi:hypothetical protein